MLEKKFRFLLLKITGIQYDSPSEIENEMKKKKQNKTVFFENQNIYQLKKKKKKKILK